MQSNNINNNEKITFVNARIYTPNGIVSGMTLENGRVSAITNSNNNSRNSAIEPEEDFFLDDDYSGQDYSRESDKSSEHIIDLKGKTVLPGFSLANADFLNIDPALETNFTDEQIVTLIRNNVAKIPSKGITELWLDLDGENFSRLSEILFDEACDSIPFRLRVNFRFSTLASLEKFLATGLRTGDGRGFSRVGAVSVGNRISPNDKRIIIETAHMAGMQVILEYNKPLLKSLNWVARKYRKNNPRHLILNPIENESLFDDMKIFGYGGICAATAQASRTLHASFQNGLAINAAAISENEPEFFRSPMQTFGPLLHNGLSMSEALSLYTWNAAWNGKVENRRGEISLGNDADLVILERDPFIVHPDEISHIEIHMTICAGSITYKNENNSAKTDAQETNLESESPEQEANSQFEMTPNVLQAEIKKR